MSAWGTVPTPSEPHHDACASVDTPIAPAMCAAYPSPVWTSQWSCRAGKNITCFGLAASTTSRVLVPTFVRRASTRSEEHTSELQSHSDLVCRLLLEKKETTTGPSNSLRRHN